LASSVISAFSSLETGQPVLAAAAAVANCSAVMPGTLPCSDRCTLLMVKPPPSGSMLTFASVASFSAEWPAASSWNASAMVKQPACAAAISSSGLVPGPFSKRVLNE
jgi:hypothetical protein